MSVLDTEISPELVPTGEDEEIQSSEAKVGPYALQDFSLFQMLRYGFRPSKVAFLAWHAWSDTEHGDWPAGFPEDKRPAYSLKEIRHWLQVFCAAVLLVRPVQEVGNAERSQGVPRRIAVAARRLAGAVGHVGENLAGRDRTRGPRGLVLGSFRGHTDSGYEASDARTVVTVGLAVLR